MTTDRAARPFEDHPTQASSEATAAHPTARERRRVLIAAGVGNFIEWYDFTVYGFVAATIAPLFFPAEDPTASLLATLAVFGVGFGMRPVGALVFGHVGDRVGRKNTLVVIIILMAVASLIIGLTPTYAQIGSLAPVVLLVGRAVQGFSVGGEFGGGAAYMVEYAPPGRRGLFGSWQMFGQILGLFTGSAIVLVLSTTLSADAMASWGWRVAFLVAVPLAAIALYLRFRLEESPDFTHVRAAQQVERSPLVTSLREHHRQLLVMIGMTCLPGIGIYVLVVFLPSYLSITRGTTTSDALLITCVELGVIAALVPVFGGLSDRLGRRPLWLVGSVGLAVAVVPGYLAYSRGSMILLLLVGVVLAVLLATIHGPFPTTLVEGFPTNVRYSSLNLCYGAATALFSGTAPFVVTWLTDVTGSALAPAWYVVAAALITVSTCLFGLRETKDAKLSHW